MTKTSKKAILYTELNKIKIIVLFALKKRVEVFPLLFVLFVFLIAWAFFAQLPFFSVFFDVGFFVSAEKFFLPFILAPKTLCLGAP